MLFVKVEELRTGMRLAKPIYNKHGVLLHERNSKLTLQNIYSIKNFGLIGLYILEPAEPVPPMSEDDIRFERFQTVGIFNIRDNLQLVANGQEPKSLDKFLSLLITNYGSLERKINFIQNLRSSSDYIYKHSLNVAILAAMIGHKMGLAGESLNRLVKAALLHEVGALTVAMPNFHIADEWSLDHKKMVRNNTSDLLLENGEIDDAVCSIIAKYHAKFMKEEEKAGVEGMDLPSNILYVADVYDRMTAMKSYEEPTSELQAIRMLLEDQEWYPSEVVGALMECINLLIPGVCLELSNGKKAVVIEDNHNNVLRPVVLSFLDNTVYDLRDDNVFKKVKIRDIMKTMDNRIKMRKVDLDLRGFRKVVMGKGVVEE